MKGNQGGLAQLVAVSDNTLLTSEAVTLTLKDRFVRTNSSTALGGVFAVTLPNVSEAAGMVFSVYAEVIADAASVTVQDNNEADGWADLVITVTGGYVVVYSDGKSWIPLASSLT